MKLTKEDINSEIEKITNNLLENAQKVCLNNFSLNIVYVIKKIYPTGRQKRISRFYIKKWWRNRNIKQLAALIEKMQNELSWVHLVLAVADNNKTYILVNLIPKLDKDDELRFHSSFPVPFNYNENVKFDINDLEFD